MTSIKTKILTGLAVTIAVPLVLIYFVIFNQVSSQSVRAFSSAARNEINQVDRAITLLLDQAKQDVSMVAANPLNEKIDQNVTSYLGPEAKPRFPAPDDQYGLAMSPFLTLLKQSHSSYDSVYLGTKWGGNVLSNTKGTRKSYDPRQRPWWGVALTNPAKAQISKAYKGTSGDPMISVVKAYQRNGEVMAVMALDMTLRELSTTMERIRFGETGYVILVQDDGVVIANPKNNDMNFKRLSELQDNTLQTLFIKGSGEAEVTLGNTPYLAQVVTSKELGWKYIGLIQKQEVLAGAYGLLTQLGLIIGGSLILIMGILWLFIDRTIVKPLVNVVNFLGTISNGNYSKRVNEQRSDEIGQIFTALDSMAETLDGNIKEITVKTTEAEEKALVAQKAVKKAEEALLLAESAKKEGMVHAAKRLENMLEKVTAVSNEISAHSTHIRNGSETQSLRISETATAMEEMNATVLEVARNSSEAAEVSTNAKDQVTTGSQFVDNSIQAMQSTQQQTEELRQNMSALGQQTDAIGNVINVITDIADQTNLLALNAAIEAARAGDAGRGFAVVADEVRKLAEKTMTATKEVSDSIKAIQKSAASNVTATQLAADELGKAVELTSQSGVVLHEILATVENSAVQIQSIATAAEEQSATSEEINHSIEEINQITEETRTDVRQTAEAVEILVGEIQSMNSVVQELKSI